MSDALHNDAELAQQYLDFGLPSLRKRWVRTQLAKMAYEVNDPSTS